MGRWICKFGAPRFCLRFSPNPFKTSIFPQIGGKNGAPQICRSNAPRIQPPTYNPLKHKHKFCGPDSAAHGQTLTPECVQVKGFSLSLGLQESRLFPCTNPWFDFSRKFLQLTNLTLVGKIPTPIKIKLALPPPPSGKTKNPPLKGGILWAWGFSSRKNPKMPGAHKIGAAISGPRITGGNFMDTTLFLSWVSARSVTN